MSGPRQYLVFDVESVGLHGDAFAVGMVLIDAHDGREIKCGMVWSNPDNVAQGSVGDREWITANIPELEHQRRVLNARMVRDFFWAAWLVADCPWPVEARFLTACIADAPTERAWNGPYPLIDVASVRLAAGLDPLGTTERFPAELPMHNPLADARQSARLFREAMEITSSVPSRFTFLARSLPMSADHDAPGTASNPLAERVCPNCGRLDDLWAELEARLCPEDVGFEEYIGALTKQLAAARSQLRTSTLEIQGLANERDELVGIGRQFANFAYNIVQVGTLTPEGWAGCRKSLDELRREWDDAREKHRLARATLRLSPTPATEEHAP
jgi:hypothetical protein